MHPELARVAISHWKTLPRVRPGLLIEFILNPVGREFTRDEAGHWQPPGRLRPETPAEQAARLKQQALAQRERLRNL